MSMPVAEGDLIADKYRVEGILGAGGMGMVVAARHLQLFERRAIKILRPEMLETPMAAKRFLREARAAARLKSEHIAKVFDMGTLPSGVPYMVMEHLEGIDLSDVLEDGPLPLRQATLFALQVCEALAEAHGLGIIHRDLKPSNLFLCRANDGAPSIKVLDFGISKLTKPLAGEHDTTKTATGTIVGSPRYMAPEQIRGDRDIDPRIDVWALGVILYELVTGRCPFEGRDTMAILAGVLETAPKPPSAQRTNLPLSLDAVILRCLEKNPDNRPADVAALARALEPFSGAEGAALARRVSRVLSTAVEPHDEDPDWFERDEDATGCALDPNAAPLSQTQPVAYVSPSQRLPSPQAARESERDKSAHVGTTHDTMQPMPSHDASSFGAVMEPSWSRTGVAPRLSTSPRAQGFLLGSLTVMALVVLSLGSTFTRRSQDPAEVDDPSPGARRFEVSSAVISPTAEPSPSAKGTAASASCAPAATSASAPPLPAASASASKARPLPSPRPASSSRSTNSNAFDHRQ